MSDPTAFKIPQIPSSVLAALGLYSQSFKILNAVEPSVALSNYYIVCTSTNTSSFYLMPMNQVISTTEVNRRLCPTLTYVKEVFF